jgi:hypothetical protein
MKHEKSGNKKLSEAARQTVHTEGIDRGFSRESPAPFFESDNEQGSNKVTKSLNGIGLQEPKTNEEEMRELIACETLS